MSKRAASASAIQGSACLCSSPTTNSRRTTSRRRTTYAQQDGRANLGVILNGDLSPTIGWDLAPVADPTLTGNTIDSGYTESPTGADLRARDDSAGNLPSLSYIQNYVANNTLGTYAYDLNSAGTALDIQTSGGISYYYVYINAGDASASGAATAGDLMIVQSGSDSSVQTIQTNNLTVKALSTSTALDLSLGSGVTSITLADYSAGNGANVTVSGNNSDDTTTGNDGSDTFNLGTGSNTVTGGSGLNTVHLSSTLTAANFSFSNNKWVISNGASTDNLSGISVVTDGSGHTFLLVGAGSQYSTPNAAYLSTQHTSNNVTIIDTPAQDETPVLSVNNGGLYVNATRAGAVAFSVSSFDDDESGTLTFSDDNSAHNVSLQVVQGTSSRFLLNNNPVSAVNLSGLTEGTITATLSVTDTAGNSETVTNSSVTLDKDLGEQAALKLAVNNTHVGKITASAVSFTIAGLDTEDTGTVTFTDGNNHKVTVPVTGATGSYSANISPLTDGTITSSLQVNTDAAGNSFTAVSGANIALNQSAAPDSSIAITSGLSNNDPTAGTTLQASVSFTAGNSATSPITYNWFVNGSQAQSGSSSSFTPTEADVGAAITVRASFTDVFSDAVLVSSAATGGVLDAAPAVSAVAVSGVPEVGQTLTASATATPADDTLTFEWFSSADNFTNPIASGPTFKVTTTSVSLEVEAIATNANGVQATAFSGEIAPLQPPPPAVNFPQRCQQQCRRVDSGEWRPMGRECGARLDTVRLRGRGCRRLQRRRHERHPMAKLDQWRHSGMADQQRRLDRHGRPRFAPRQFQDRRALAISPAMASTMCCGPAPPAAGSRQTSGSSAPTANGARASVRARIRRATMSSVSAISTATARATSCGRTRPPAMSTSGRSSMANGPPASILVRIRAPAGLLRGSATSSATASTTSSGPTPRGGQVQTDIWKLGSNGQWAASVSPGTHPAGYQVAAVGNFADTGTDGMLVVQFKHRRYRRMAALSNGQWAASFDLGTHPGGFQIAGAGAFVNGNATSDVLWQHKT